MLKGILSAKLKSRSALLAMNAQSIQQIDIAADLAMKTKKEVIIQFSAKYVPYFEKLIGYKYLLEKYRDNRYIFFHLDHCQDFNLIQECVNYGFHSVMFDGSSLPLEENIIRTCEVVRMARDKNVLVEGEVGVVGGVEDGHNSGKSSVFNSDEAIEFYRRTEVDLLALGIGNAHGVYKGTEEVKIELFKEFQSKLENEALLVLHGATGLSEVQVRESIDYGVVKVNYSTEFKLVYQQVINSLAKLKLHDEITFFELLKDELNPVLQTIIKILDNVSNS
jgi:ketose-bisphosphate aldolase